MNMAQPDLHKVVESLKSSIGYLKNANDSLHENDRQTALKKLILAKTNVEFATAYYRLLFDLDDGDDHWKGKIKARRLRSSDEILKALSEAASLISEALSCLESFPERSYRLLWFSRIKIDSAILSTKRG